MPGARCNAQFGADAVRDRTQGLPAKGKVMGLTTILFYLFLVGFFLVCVLLVLVILAQEGKGGGLSGIAGSSALGETFGFGDAGNAMRRWTRNIAIIFFVMAIILTFWGEHQTSAITKQFLAGGEAPVAQPLQPIAPGGEQAPEGAATTTEQPPATQEPAAPAEPPATPQPASQAEPAAAPEPASTPEPATTPEPAATPEPSAPEAATPPAEPQTTPDTAPETTTTQ